MSDYYQQYVSVICGITSDILYPLWIIYKINYSRFIAFIKKSKIYPYSCLSTCNISEFELKNRRSTARVGILLSLVLTLDVFVHMKVSPVSANGICTGPVL